MKAYLLYRNRDVQLDDPLPWNADALTQDLELDSLFAAMADGDEFLAKVAQHSLLTGLHSADDVRYRQHILADALAHETAVRELYRVTVDAIARERTVYFGIFSKYPSAILHRAVAVLTLLLESLQAVRQLAAEQSDAFTSDGFTQFFRMMRAELDDDYVQRVRQHLQDLTFADGVLVSSVLGEGNRAEAYTLRELDGKRDTWLQRLTGKGKPSFTFTLSDRDESGARALSELRDRSINEVANAVAQAADHILQFFTMLRTEIGFYVGCLNLAARLAQQQTPICFPEVLAASTRPLRFRNLRDVCLSLRQGKEVVGTSVVGTSVDASDKDLIIITGANQGGKSTFLRSVGTAQLMLQAGLFVAADAYSGRVCTGLFSHYRREEDEQLNSGKFDEELKRMSDIVGHVRANALLLSNESFAATNEREGAAIATEIVRALLENDIQVIAVTHLYDFAHEWQNQDTDRVLFLRAERLPGGRRTYQLRIGAPEQTSYGVDLYKRIFSPPPDLAP